MERLPKTRIVEGVLGPMAVAVVYSEAEAAEAYANGGLPLDQAPHSHWWVQTQMGEYPRFGEEILGAEF